MKDVVICAPYRTPVGRFGGQFKELQAHELAAQLLRGLIQRTGLPGAAVDDVIFAQCYPTMDAPALGRVVALDAGLPIEVGGYQIDRRCGSGLQAVINAVMQVATGASTLVLAGGTESMSNAPFYATSYRRGVKGNSMRFEDALSRGRVTAGGVHYPVPGGMLETAENLRRDYGISRLEQDELAVESHRRAVAAQAKGTFGKEIIPITVRSRKGDTVVSADEHPRADANLDSLSALKPIRVGVDPDSTVTAGNTSGQNDGASACIVTTRDKAQQLGLTPLASLRAWAIAGVAPSHMGIGPVPATAKVLAQTGLTLKDIDLIELNEAFAAQVLACTREWRFGPGDFQRMNVHGSGISMGHPVGATGGRILATLLNEMQRREAGFGLETMCIGGGQGLAALFERVN
ncbi:acetyl-CoA C-acetyltransferase [Thalassovita sp.]|uniref:acetyl-CoA C-acetyltransferase n=1 Tax=Thalassovita sp. TaxID=1979401 RepID=UPI0029DE8742|nr:acetyl-CoA C-acetyltransferase [Thalassovita sp.]